MYHSVLSRKQQIVIWTGLLLFAQIGVYPPWIQEWSDGNDHIAPTASVHHWIFSPPGPPAWVWSRAGESIKIPALWSSHLDVARLLAEWATVVMVFGGISWTLRKST